MYVFLIFWVKHSPPSVISALPCQSVFNIGVRPYRLELKGNKYVLGEFIEFKGKQEDLEDLSKIRRSKISHLAVQKISMFGLGNSYAPPHSFSFCLNCKVRSCIWPLMFGWSSFTPRAAHSTVQVLYTPRDYRTEGPSRSSEWKEVTVRSSTEVLFQPQSSKKQRKYKLSSVISLSLGAWRLKSHDAEYRTWFQFLSTACIYESLTKMCIV